jgi:hypothetical protein
MRVAVLFKSQLKTKNPKKIQNPKIKNIENFGF